MQAAVEVEHLGASLEIERVRALSEKLNQRVSDTISAQTRKVAKHV